MQSWPTPTPRPTADPATLATPVLDLEQLSEFTYTMSEEIVQGYHTANQTGIVDMMMYGVIVIIVIVGLWSIIHHIQEI